MSNKIKVLMDRPTIKDNKSIIYPGCGIKGTDVCIKDNITGKELFKGRNSVIVPGSIFTAQCHFPRMSMPISLPNYNTTLNLDETTTSARPDDQPKQIWLFAVGTDGAGAEASQVYDVDLTKWIPQDKLVPFRYVDIDDDLSAADREMYFGRRTYSNYIAYYFKAFSAEPVCYPLYADGTAISNTMYTDTSQDPEIRVELQFKVTKEDCREWFKLFSAGGVNDAKVNTLSLLSAWYTVGVDGYRYYQDINPVTKLNFTTEYLADETKGLDIIYNIYY